MLLSASRAIWALPHQSQSNFQVEEGQDLTEYTWE